MDFKKGDNTLDTVGSYLDELRFVSPSGSITRLAKEADTTLANWNIEEVFVRGSNNLTELIEGTVLSWDSTYLEDAGVSRWGVIFTLEIHMARGSGTPVGSWIAMASASKNAIDAYFVGTPTILYNSIGGTTVAWNEAAGVYTLDVTLDDQTISTGIAFGRIRGEVYKETL